jgi:Ca2+-transporting ATPase
MADTADERPPPYPWHANSKADCYKELGCADNLQAVGLTTADAQKRLETYGPNKLSEKEKVTLLQRIWHQVANVLVGILVFVAVVSAIRAATADESTVIVTNTIQVGLILFVIT